MSDTNKIINQKDYEIHPLHVLLLLSMGFLGHKDYLFVHIGIVWIILSGLMIRTKDSSPGEKRRIHPLFKKPYNYMLIFYLIYWITVLLHYVPVADYLIRLHPLFSTFYNGALNYSSQFNSTYLMLFGRICLLAMLIIMIHMIIAFTCRFGIEGWFNRFIYKGRIIIFGLSLSFLTAMYMNQALHRHNTFNSKAWDLAIFAQLIDNFRHGVFFEANVRGVSNIFADHFNPIIYIFSPFLYIWSDPSRLLLVAQSLFICTGAIPIYLIAKRHLKSITPSYIFSLIYLLYPALMFMNLADFHPVVLSIPFMLFALHFWDLKRFPLMYLFLGLSMLCHEQMWIVVGAFGLFMAIFKNQKKHGLILTAIGWGGFILLVTLFFPHFRTGEEYFYIHRYAWLGESLGEIAKNFFTKPWLWIPKLISPRALIFIFLLLAPVAFLPIYRAKYLLILIPTYIYSALSNEPLQLSITAQYAAPYVPFIIFATVHGLREFLSRTEIKFEHVDRVKASLWIFIITFVSSAFFSTVPYSLAYPESMLKVSDVDKYGIETILNQADPADFKSVDSRFAPHLISRELFLWPDKYESADVVIMDLHNVNRVADYKKQLEIRTYLEQKSLEYNNNSLLGYHGGSLFFWKQSEENTTELYGYRISNLSFSEKHREMIESGQIYFSVWMDMDEDNFFGNFYGVAQDVLVESFWEIDEQKLKAISKEQYDRSAFLDYPGEQKYGNIPDQLVLLFMKVPENYPNTLEEYFTERYIQNHWRFDTDAWPAVFDCFAANENLLILVER